MYWKSIRLLLLAAPAIFAHPIICGAQSVQGILVRGRDHQPVGGARLQLVDWPRAVLDAYLPEDVSRKAVMKPHPGFRGPRYPDHMLASGRGGVVRAQFVVDRSGRADMSTFQVLESDDFLFTRSVREAAAQVEFVPAELAGTPVPQIWEMDVEFQLGDGPSRLHGSHVWTITATPAS